MENMTKNDKKMIRAWHKKLQPIHTTKTPLKKACKKSGYMKMVKPKEWGGGTAYKKCQ